MKRQILLFLFCFYAFSEHQLFATKPEPEVTTRQTNWLAYSVLFTGLVTMGLDVKKALHKFEKENEQKKPVSPWNDEELSTKKEDKSQHDLKKEPKEPFNIDHSKTIKKAPFAQNKKTSKGSYLKKFLTFYKHRLFTEYKCAPLLMGATLTTLATTQIITSQTATSSSLNEKTEKTLDDTSSDEANKKPSVNKKTPSHTSPPPPPPSFTDDKKEDSPEKKDLSYRPKPKDVLEKEFNNQLIQKRDELELDGTTTITKELIEKINTIKSYRLKNAVYASFTEQQKKERAALRKGSQEEIHEAKKETLKLFSSGEAHKKLRKVVVDGKSISGDEARKKSKEKAKTNKGDSIFDSAAKLIQEKFKSSRDTSDKDENDHDDGEWDDE